MKNDLSERPLPNMVVGRISRVGGIYGGCRGRTDVLRVKGKGNSD
jgi:hypothetical protein